ncbi:AraC family transcriptional regulator [Acrocarpospora corrugata]|uniref:AraC family transcriptional regulator n=1 Tax=Acrocarpospora corrugata TaxID=35763 RepID=A0A5M3W2Z6_9ACTN|nr:helix-turn-helix domain-containing protein [Acrocarpospora corrugata]GES00978.1 AraC family transcriptional regulator [Acrocarpospora corrugata]
MAPGSVAIAVAGDISSCMWDMYEIAVPCSVFGMPQPDLADPWYDLRLCAADTPVVEQGFSLRTPYRFADLADADTVIVAAVPEAVAQGKPFAPGLVEELRRAADAGARMVSLCCGAFALAEAGLLDGRRATTHWMYADEMAKRYPKVRVDSSVLYVDDCDVLTSAGMSAGLDLCLHLVRCDLGAHVANQLARRMVVPAHRFGGQAQFIDLAVPVTDDESLGPVLQWAIEHLDRPLTVDELARQAGLSTRTFYRRLQSVTGTTPLKWLLNQRIARAQTLLETTSLPIEKISEHSGLGTATNLRRHFTQQVGVTPTEYRRAFDAPPSA